MAGKDEGGPEQEASPFDESSVLLEFHRVGNAVKVSAVDPQTLVEASIVGDPAMGEPALAHAAIRKLRYVLQRRARKRDAAPDVPPPAPRRGTLV
jgi:hypothetical protein